MALPAQLRKQVEETEAFYKKDADEEKDNVQAKDGEDQSNDRTISETAPSTDDNTTDDITTQADEIATKPQSDDSDSGQQHEPDAEEKLRAAQQRYSSLQGMYNSTIANLRDAQQQIDQLRQAITQLQTPRPAEQQAPKPAVAGKAVTDAELEEYSPEFFEMLDRYIGSKISPLQASLESVHQLPDTVNRLNDQLGSVAASQARNAEDKFFDGLAGLHPDWQQINNSREYAEWLQVVDPLSGYTRKALLDGARERLDLNLVSNSFAEFKAATRTIGKAVPNKSHKDELRQQAVLSPRRGQSSIPTDSGGKKIFSKADLDKLYGDQLHGKYRGPEKEAVFKAREAELLQAIAEGRYTS